LRWGQCFFSHRVFPKHLVPGHEGQVNARGARRLDIGSLAGRPILVMSNRQEYLAIQQLCAVAIGVDAGDVSTRRSRWPRESESRNTPLKKGNLEGRRRFQCYREWQKGRLLN